MNQLIINSTAESPEVNFDLKSRIFTIGGESRPENAGTFYKPIIHYISNLSFELALTNNETTNSLPLNFIFKYAYFNSTSAKYIADIFKNISELIEKGNAVNIDWYYDKRDEDMLDAGTEFSELFNLKIQLLEY